MAEKYTIYGKKVAFPAEDLPDCGLLESAEITKTQDMKDFSDMSGCIVSRVETNARLTGSASGVMLADTTVDALVAALKTWLAGKVEIFGLATGGTTTVSDIKLSGASGDAEKWSVSLEYLPYCAE